MVNDNQTQLEIERCLLRNLFQLMLRHYPVDFVFDSLDLAIVFQTAHHAPKIDNRSRRKIDILTGQLQSLFGQENVTNGICHAL